MGSSANQAITYFFDVGLLPSSRKKMIFRITEGRHLPKNNTPKSYYIYKASEA